MIIGSLKNTARIEASHPGIKAFFDYVKKHDMSQEALETKVLSADEVFFTPMKLKGKKPQEALLEAHKNYLDIQLLLEGSERIGWKALEDAEVVEAPYNKDNDIVFYADKSDSYIQLKPGQFAVIFPEDLHAPGVSEGALHKVVAKVKL